MIYFHDTTNFKIERPSVVTLGKFDGVHRGHCKLMRKVLEISEDQNLLSVVFTLNPKQESLILSKQEQKDYLEQIGIDALIDCPPRQEIFHLSPKSFIEDILIGKFKAKAVVVGEDFRFGYRRQGDAMMLRAIAGTYGVETYILTKEIYNGREISSTYIREAIDAGDVQLVSMLMGRCFSLSGTVIHGNHLGSSMGMPTANIIPDPSKLLPPNGVYISQTRIDGKIYPGVTNIGTKPTVGSSFTGAETYMFDVDAPLYGKFITVELLKYTRPEQKFGSLDELKDQIRKDIDFGKEYFRNE